MATTCGQDGFLEHDACDAGTECKTYTLHEKRFNADPDNPAWIDAREVTWAACLPAIATACPVEWNGNYYWPTNAPHCDGPQKISCRMVPAPDLFSNSPQLLYGADEGYVQSDACASGSKCAGGDTIDVLTCIDEDTPACDGTEPSCSGNGIEYCGGTWESLPGYKVVEPCQGANVCYEGTGGPFCGPAGEVPCAEGTSPACAPDDASIVGCYNGFTYHQSCAMCSSPTGQVPCRCDETASSSGWTWTPNGLVCSESMWPACVPAAAPDCDPATDADTCVGNVAHRCLGHWEDIDCAAVGKVCGVGDGVAGCRAANAPACSTGANESCAGTEIVGCCTCGSLQVLFGPQLDAPCVSGFEARVDCADMGTYHCETTAVWAECKFGP